MTSTSLIATAVGLGLAYAAAPGAVNTEALRRGVTWGARSALLVETGSLIGDSLWAVLALTGVTLLTRYLALQILLGITGGFFLLRLAWLALSEAFARRHATTGNVSSTQGDFATGVVFGLANPVGLALWLMLMQDSYPPALVLQNGVHATSRLFNRHTLASTAHW